MASVLAQPLARIGLAIPAKPTGIVFDPFSTASIGVNFCHEPTVTKGNRRRHGASYLEREWSFAARNL
jgi:hypothetical protein